MNRIVAMLLAIALAIALTLLVVLFSPRGQRMIERTSAQQPANFWKIPGILGRPLSRPS